MSGNINQQSSQVAQAGFQTNFQSGQQYDPLSNQLNFVNRNTGLHPRILGTDATAIAPFVIFLYHLRLWTLVLFVGFVIFFFILERRNFYISSLKGLVLWHLSGRQTDMHVGEIPTKW